MQQGFTFEADDRPLSDIFFETKRKYRIPRYQRPYAWGTDQITAFWEDLISNDEPYFLGSFIFNNEQEKTEGFVDIIDGQQRLLTITIFLAVIRDLANKIDKTQAGLFQRQDIAIEDWEGKSSYRIQPAESLEGYFQEYIQGTTQDIWSSITSNSTKEEKKVKENYEFLHSKMKVELDRFPNKDAKMEVLKRYRKKIRELMVINVEISREEDAYDIFETTNARGMELSVSDLLKNLVFKNIPAGNDRDLAKDIWSEITKQVEDTQTDLKRFIRYFWISKHKFVPERKLFKEIKNEISKTQWTDFLQALWDDAIRFNRLLEGDQAEYQDYKKHGNKIFESVFAIRLMKVSQCYVLLLSILRNYNNLGFDPYRFIQFIEKFTFQYSVVCKLPGNRVEKIYSKYAIEIDEAAKNGTSEKVISRLLSTLSKVENELKEIMPSETVFKESFAGLELKNSEESRRLIKYILGRINAYFQKTEEYIINFDIVNIEHILPQTPDKEWKLTKKDIRGYVNKIGNLTLLSKRLNSKAQNSIISKKIGELKKSDLAITETLVNKLELMEHQWGEEQINNRQAELADISYKYVWKI